MRTKLIVIIGMSVALLGAFQNCSSGSLPDVSTAASVAASSSNLLPGTLAVNASPSGTVNVNDTVVFNVIAQNVQTISYSCVIAATNAGVAGGTLPPGQTTFSVQVPAALRCTVTGIGTNLIAQPQPYVIEVGITPPPQSTPTPTPAPAPTPTPAPVTGTWQPTMPTAVPLGSSNFPRFGECARGPAPVGTCSLLGAQCTYYSAQTNPLSGASYTYFINYRCSL